MKGKVKWYNEFKDLGFVETESGETVLITSKSFKNRNDLKKALANAEVKFKVRPTTNEAEEITAEKLEII